MLVEESKLRWCGIDMRSRARRRVAVVSTFVVWLVVLFVWTRTFASSGGLCIAGWNAASLVLISWSVFRQVGGVVKPLETLQQFRYVGGRRMEVVEGLDGFASYRFGAESFAKATPEQQKQLLEEHHFGEFVLPVRNEPVMPWFDEREKKVRARIEEWALQLVCSFMALTCVVVVLFNRGHYVIHPIWAGLYLWCLAWSAFLLPRARILWTEPDPRESAGELHLVEGTEA